jgi:hypothetical protein
MIRELEPKNEFIGAYFFIQFILSISAGMKLILARWEAGTSTEHSSLMFTLPLER